MDHQEEDTGTPVERKAQESRDKLHVEFQAMQEALAELKEQFASIKDDLGKILEVFEAVAGSIKVIGWIGGFVRWGSLLAAAVIGLVWASKGGPHQ